MNDLPELELNQDERRYTGVALKTNDQKFSDKNKPWRLIVFANSHGTFEASFDLTLDEAEAMRDWLDKLIKDLRPL